MDLNQAAAWIVLGIFSVIRFQADYCLVVGVCLTLSIANIVGFTKCRKGCSGITALEKRCHAKEDGSVYEAEYVMLSVSIGVLQSSLISFQLHLHEKSHNGVQERINGGSEMVVANVET